MPPLSNPFPVSAETQVWLAVVQALKSDPVLSSRVDTWQVWDGSEDALAEPTDENLPLLRIEPDTGNSSWLDEATHQFRWPLKITLGVDGGDVTQLLDFWAAIRAALFTGNTLLNLLYPLGVIQKTITSPSSKPHLWGDTTGLMGQGTLSILMRVNAY